MICHARIDRDVSGYPICASTDHEDDREAMDCAADRDVDSIGSMWRDLWPFFAPLLAVVAALGMFLVVLALYLWKPGLAAWGRSWW